MDISPIQICRYLRRSKAVSGLAGKPGWDRKSRWFPDATKVTAIVTDKCYQTVCILPHIQNGMAKTTFMKLCIFRLFVSQYHLLEICVDNLQMPVFSKNSWIAAPCGPCDRRRYTTQQSVHHMRQCSPPTQCNTGCRLVTSDNAT